MEYLENAANATDKSLLVVADRRASVRTANLVVTVLVMLGATLRWAVLGFESAPLPGILVVLLGLGNAAYIARGGSTAIAARFLIGVIALGLIYGGYNSGGFVGPIMLLAPLLPIISLLLFERRAGWIVAGLMIICLVSVLLLHLTGTMPENIQGEKTLILGRFLAISFSGLLATWVVWTFAGTATALSTRNEQLANLDHLTGIANRRAIESALTSEIRRARRSERCLSFILADVDSFKRYNDVNGHPAGDQCLIRVARVMVECARRPGDLVGRFGGEEFVAILPETDAEGARKIAEIMRQALLDEAIPYEPEGSEMLSMTFGVVSRPGQDIESASSLIKIADGALYEGKEAGRNRVVLR